MKLLPCAKCGIASAGEAGPLEAVHYGVLRRPGSRGLPYYLANYPGNGTFFRYSCSVCGSVRTLTPIEFNALPEAGPEELERSGVLAHVSKDHTLGGKVPMEQAKEYFLLGVMPKHTRDLHAAWVTASEILALPAPVRRAR